ncbi:MAG: mechanosensitive ion channel domain-containing protein [Promethearchaeota archaeon]
MPFNTDLDALIIILIIAIILYLLNKFISSFLGQIKKLSNRQRNISNFALRITSIIIVVYLIIEGFPSFNALPPEYTAILTSSISTALAFVSSEIFSNFMAGLLLIIIDPFDLGDIIRIGNKKGIVFSSTLTKVILETFDRIKVDIYNKELISSNIINYTKKLKNIKHFYQFREKLNFPQYKGEAHLGGFLFVDEDEDEKELKELYEIVKKDDRELIHAFTFNMRYPYKQLRIKIHQTDNLCVKYKEKFGFKPRFHVVNFGFELYVKFRVISLNAKSIMDYQPKLAEELYKIILG